MPIFGLAWLPIRARNQWARFDGGPPTVPGRADGVPRTATAVAFASKARNTGDSSQYF
jgi:hypothetical protein